MLKELIESNQEDIQMIIFKLGDEEYAVPITEIQEIITPQAPTRIPKSPSFVKGVINLRGQIIPIIDGKKKFFLDNAKDEVEADNRIMIIDTDGQTAGLTVDSVSEVIHLKVDDIEPPPIEMTQGKEFLWGVGKHADRLLILLDPKKILNFDEAEQVSNLSEISSTIKELDSRVK